MNWDALTEVINKEIRNHLGVVEKRNEELKLALEVANRERDEAREDAKWMSKYAKELMGLIDKQGN
jgi:F0F1-type ATP synthase membrane subunit b/b'